MTDEDAIQAAELALGVLDGDERAAAMRRVVGEPAFARTVARWRDRFGALHADWVDADPGPVAERRAAAIGAQAGVVPDEAKAAAARWRGIAAVAGIAAAALLAVVVLRPAAPPAPASTPRSAPLLVAVLAPTDGAAFGAVCDPARRKVQLTGSVAVPRGRDAELWTIGADGVPHAAGLVPRGGDRRLLLAPGATVTPGATLALSIEPAGGSAGPTPSGPVVATGKLVAI